MDNDDLKMIKNDLRQYVIYSRKSKFTGKGESVENQIEICKAYIKSKFDINIKDENIIIKQDEGFSGKDINRPQFKDMMNLVKEKKVKMIVVYKLDRLSRNVLDFCEMYNELEKYNTKFASVSENFDTTTSIGRAMLMITMTFAQLERETIAERIKDNMIELAKTGRWLGGNTPMGYKSAKTEKFNINNKRVSLCKLCAINDELEIIKLIYYKYLKMKSLTTLETYLINNNIKTRRDCTFSRWGLKKILTNPVYAIADTDMLKYFQKNNMNVFNNEIDWNGKYGVMSYNKTIKTKSGTIKIKEKEQWINAIGKHKGIIKGKDWIKVQELLNNNQNKAYRMPTKNESILSGLLKCEYCGSLMRPKLKSSILPDGKRRFDYICDLKIKSKGKKCSCPNLNGNKADYFVISSLESLFYPTNMFYQEIIKTIKRDINNTSKPNEIDILKKKYSKNCLYIDNYISRIKQVDNSLLKDIQNKIKELKLQNAIIIKRIKEIEVQKDKHNDKSIISKSLFETYMKNFTELDIISQRDFLKQLIENCITNGKEIIISMVGTKKSKTIKQLSFNKF